MTAPSTTASAPASPSRGRLGLLRQPDFAKLWVGDTISQFGTQISLLAVPLIGASILQVPPEQFALLGFFEFLPFILISLPAGVWVDRLRRRPILISGDLVRAVSLLSIPIAYELGVLTIWQLYVVGFVNGVATVFFDVAYQSYLPSLVERDEIVEGNSKLEVSRSAAQIVGPGVGGRPRRRALGAGRGHRRCDQLRGLGRLRLLHPPAGAACGAARLRARPRA